MWMGLENIMLVESRPPSISLHLDLKMSILFKQEGAPEPKNNHGYLVVRNKLRYQGLTDVYLT